MRVLLLFCLWLCFFAASGESIDVTASAATDSAALLALVPGESANLTLIMDLAPGVTRSYTGLTVETLVLQGDVATGAPARGIITFSDLVVRRTLHVSESGANPENSLTFQRCRLGPDTPSNADSFEPTVNVTAFQSVVFDSCVIRPAFTRAPATVVIQSALSSSTVIDSATITNCTISTLNYTAAIGDAAVEAVSLPFAAAVLVTAPERIVSLSVTRNRIYASGIGVGVTSASASSLLINISSNDVVVEPQSKAAIAAKRADAAFQSAFETLSEFAGAVSAIQIGAETNRLAGELSLVLFRVVALGQLIVDGNTVTTRLEQLRSPRDLRLTTSILPGDGSAMPISPQLRLISIYGKANKNDAFTGGLGAMSFTAQQIHINANTVSLNGCGDQVGSLPSFEEQSADAAVNRSASMSAAMASVRTVAIEDASSGVHVDGCAFSEGASIRRNSVVVCGLRHVTANVTLPAVNASNKEADVRPWDVKLNVSGISLSGTQSLSITVCPPMVVSNNSIDVLVVDDFLVSGLRFGNTIEEGALKVGDFPNELWTGTFPLMLLGGIEVSSNQIRVESFAGFSTMWATGGLVFNESLIMDFPFPASFPVTPEKNPNVMISNNELHIKSTAEYGGGLLIARAVVSTDNLDIVTNNASILTTDTNAALWIDDSHMQIGDIRVRFSTLFVKRIHVNSNYLRSNVLGPANAARIGAEYYCCMQAVASIDGDLFEFSSNDCKIVATGRGQGVGFVGSVYNFTAFEARRNVIHVTSQIRAAALSFILAYTATSITISDSDFFVNSTEVSAIVGFRTTVVDLRTFTFSFNNATLHADPTGSVVLGSGFANIESVTADHNDVVVYQSLYQTITMARCMSRTLAVGIAFFGQFYSTDVTGGTIGQVSSVNINGVENVTLMAARHNKIAANAACAFAALTITNYARNVTLEFSSNVVVVAGHPDERPVTPTDVGANEAPTPAITNVDDIALRSGRQTVTRRVFSASILSTLDRLESTVTLRAYYNDVTTYSSLYSDATCVNIVLETTGKIGSGAPVKIDVRRNKMTVNGGRTASLVGFQNTPDHLTPPPHARPCSIDLRDSELIVINVTDGGVLVGSASAVNTTRPAIKLTDTTVSIRDTNLTIATVFSPALALVFSPALGYAQIRGVHTSVAIGRALPTVVVNMRYPFPLTQYPRLSPATGVERGALMLFGTNDTSVDFLNNIYDVDTDWASDDAVSLLAPWGEEFSSSTAGATNPESEGVAFPPRSYNDLQDLPLGSVQGSQEFIDTSSVVCAIVATTAAWTQKLRLQLRDSFVRFPPRNDGAVSVIHSPTPAPSMWDAAEVLISKLAVEPANARLFPSDDLPKLLPDGSQGSSVKCVSVGGVKVNPSFFAARGSTVPPGLSIRDCSPIETYCAFPFKRYDFLECQSFTTSASRTVTASMTATPTLLPSATQTHRATATENETDTVTISESVSFLPAFVVAEGIEDGVPVGVFMAADAATRTITFRIKNGTDSFASFVEPSPKCVLFFDIEYNGGAAAAAMIAQGRRSASTEVFIRASLTHMNNVTVSEANHTKLRVMLPYLPLMPKVQTVGGGSSIAAPMYTSLRFDVHLAPGCFKARSNPPKVNITIPANAKPPPPPVMSDLTSGIASTGAAISGVLGSSTTGPVAVRLGALAAMAACDMDDPEPPDIASSPTQAAIGTDRVRFHVGTAVYDTAMFLGFFFLNFVVGCFFSFFGRTSLVEGMASARFPSVGSFAFLFWMQPVIEASISCLAFAEGTWPRLIGAGTLAITVGILVFIAYTLIFAFQAKRVRAKVKKTAPALVRTSWKSWVRYFAWLTRSRGDWIDTAPPVPHRRPLPLQHADSTSDDDGDSYVPFHDKATTHSSKAHSHSDGPMADNGRSDDENGRPKGPMEGPGEQHQAFETVLEERSFVRRYALLFVDYTARARWFLLVEAGVGVATALCGATAVTAGCVAVSWGMAAVFGLYLAALLFFRCFESRVNFAFVVMVAALQLLVALFTAFNHALHDGDNEDLLKAAEVVIFLIALLSIARAGYDIVVVVFVVGTSYGAAASASLKNASMWGGIAFTEVFAFAKATPKDKTAEKQGGADFLTKSDGDEGDESDSDGAEMAVLPPAREPRSRGLLPSENGQAPDHELLDGHDRVHPQYADYHVPPPLPPAVHVDAREVIGELQDQYQQLLALDELLARQGRSRTVHGRLAHHQ